MRRILLAAGLMFAGSAWGEGIDFWVNFGETLVSSPGLGSGLCPTGITAAACMALGATPNDVALSKGFGDGSAGDGFHFGFRGDFNGGDHLGYEVGYLYNRTNLKQSEEGVLLSEQGMAYHQVAFNAMYYFTEPDSKIRPFVTGGVGFTNYAPPGQSAAYGGGSTKLGFNGGGGVKMKLTSRYGLRLDVREATTPKPFGFPLASGWLRETEVSVGFGIFF